MKKFKLPILIILALLISNGAKAQTTFGIKGAVAANWIPKTMLLGAERVVPNFGFHAGVLANFEMSDALFLQTEVLYARKGHTDRTRLESYNDTYKLNLSYVQIPVMLGIKLADGKYSIMFGPELGFNTGAKVIDNDNIVGKTSWDVKDYVQPLNLALAIQTAYFFTDNWGLDVKFDFGLTNTFKNIEYRIKDRTLKDKGHNTSIEVGLCYIFE